jgi:type III restriction enzyme
VSGGLKKVKQPGEVMEKADTVRGLWLPAINGHGGYGMWDYLEVHDPSTAPRAIRTSAQALLARMREVAA